MSAPRLLAGLRSDRPLTHAEHTAIHGDLPDRRPAALIRAVEQAGLSGRGGAGFPTARKLEAVASRSGPKVVVANGVEAEPMSDKDRVLLTRAPHLVLDGVQAAASAVGAREAIVCVPADAAGSVDAALADRGHLGSLRVRVVTVPQNYLAGEETALVRHLNRGPLKPTFTPPLPFERGVRRRPTLVQNVETLAHLALVARHGPEWFRSAGTSTAPGTILVTLAGAVRRPGVVEVAGGTSVGAALSRADVASKALASVILGGYFGTWLPATSALALTLDPPTLARHGAALGAGVIVALADTTCAVAELARLMAWLSAESAGQCGPCTHGLSAIAGTVGRMRDGTAGAGAEEQLQRWAGRRPGTRSLPAPRRRCATAGQRAAHPRGAAARPHAPRQPAMHASGTRCSPHRRWRAGPHDPPAAGEPDPVHRTWDVRRAAPGAHHAR